MVIAKCSLPAGGKYEIQVIIKGTCYSECEVTIEAGARSSIPRHCRGYAFSNLPFKFGLEVK